MYEWFQVVGGMAFAVVALVLVGFFICIDPWGDK